MGMQAQDAADFLQFAPGAIHHAVVPPNSVSYVPPAWVLCEKVVNHRCAFGFRANLLVSNARAIGNMNLLRVCGQDSGANPEELAAMQQCLDAMKQNQRLVKVKAEEEGEEAAATPEEAAAADNLASAVADGAAAEAEVPAPADAEVPADPALGGDATPVPADPALGDATLDGTHTDTVDEGWPGEEDQEAAAAEAQQFGGEDFAPDEEVGQEGAVGVDEEDL